MSTKLPAVLQTTSKRNTSISMERALKQIKDLLEQHPTADADTENSLQASIDDVEMMLAAIDRS